MSGIMQNGIKNLWEEQISSLCTYYYRYSNLLRSPFLKNVIGVLCRYKVPYTRSNSMPGIDGQMPSDLF